ncbi:zeaxanthin epoxidase, chloroplastic [Ricinus communis]|uniref:Zeaxanthin epoxidase, chloroplastic n=1 Tax=Ricinus communis TaxID=3988 RepID=B9SC68_RICCO|nr:zeaxanthin epoxidase, chloroplastic [Ricinus communis]EEF38782.1 zeaxanthin epoxidase, putative [Ricinus communis]|eukprot:XP_002523587.1 zeaxanthin epoxidase, chloroplastic [Ricinus communis]
MASSAFFCNSINPSTSVFSRTHFSFPIFSTSTVEFSSFAQYNFHFKTKKSDHQNKRFTQVKAVVTESPTVAESNGKLSEQKKLRILVAGGGIGGLVFALAAKRKGFEVLVFEKDLSAIRGEGQYRGPIQVQSNALAALEAIDLEVAEEVMRAGCITGDRINGLVDGVSGTWYCKFDTFTPAAERGLPVTRVISRMTLQQILACAVGEDVIMNASNVINFQDNEDKVTVTLENGQQFEGDLLVGADGIWSKVRKNLFGPKEATYSGYTCYTGIADFVPVDIESVGYRVFLGHKQYFVSSDVGAGKMQWYAFHNEPPGGVDSPNGKKERLLKIFEGWCDNVIDLLHATDEDAILRRDIYDREPVFTWGKGRVTLLGDSIHAMQPNMGQGGCMAIEDSYQLALELDKAWKQSIESGTPVDVVSSLKSYERTRRLRVAIIHGMARMAAIMASTYKAYLGVGLGPLSFLTKYRIPHPGRVGGRFFIDIAMPVMLNWVLGGNSSKLEGRPLSCRLSDKASDQLQTWFEDDNALERALNGEWFLLPFGDDAVQEPICLSRDENIPCMVGSESQEDFPGKSIVISSPQVSKMHARISYKDGGFYVIDLQSEHGTFITDNDGRRSRVPPNFPTLFHPSEAIEFGSAGKAKFRVKVMKSPAKIKEKGGNEILQSV